MIIKYSITIKTHKKKKIKYFSKKTLLKILQKNNIFTAYQCQKGYCGICRILLLKGKIKYIKDTSMVILNKKEILTCCSIPIKNITIKI